MDPQSRAMRALRQHFGETAQSYPGLAGLIAFEISEATRVERQRCVSLVRREKLCKEDVESDKANGHGDSAIHYNMAINHALHALGEPLEKTEEVWATK